MSDRFPPLTGRCHCGGLRFRVEAPPVDSGWCHCSICRRTTGAPALVWVTVDRAATVLEGAPRRYRSSATAERWFCGTCGAQLAFAPIGAATFDLMAGLFDEPARVAPRRHVFAADDLGWIGHDDHLPRIADDGDPAPAPVASPKGPEFRD